MKTLLIFIAFVTSLGAQAQSLKASVDKPNPAVGEHFTLTFSIDENIKNFQGPDLSKFQVFSGPNHSSSFSMVNGRTSVNQSYSYVLAPMQTGAHTIGPAKAMANGKPIQSNSVEINVTGRKSAAQSGQPSASGPARNSQPAQNAQDMGSDDIEANLFMKLFLDKRKAVVGEQIVATYKLYVNIPIRDNSITKPVYNGFYAQDVEVDINASAVNEEINGKNFKVFTISKVVLTPQQSGQLEVPEIVMPMVVQVQDNRRPRSIFDQMFGTSKNVKVEVKSNKETVTISALKPDTDHSDFQGAVGSFKLNASTDRSELNINDAINLTVTIEGKGNLELIKAPNIQFPNDFESYEPKVRESISVGGSGTSGKKIFEYVLIPRHAGDFTLDPIRFTYYDPSSESFKRLQTDPIAIHVLKSDNEESNDDVAYIASKKEEVQMIGRDIRFIHTKTELIPTDNTSFFGTALFYLLSALPFLVFGGAIAFLNRYRKQNNDPVALRKRRAKSTAQRRLTLAKKMLRTNDPKFYDELFKALYGYLGDKLSIENSNLNRETIESSMRDLHVSEESIRQVKATLDECELARFAPTIARSKPELVDAAQQLFENIENEV